MWKKIRCKSSHDLSCQYRIGQNKDGKWKAMSLGSIKSRGRPVPTDFAPFELMNAVVNGPVFPTQDQAEKYVRGL